MGIRIILPKGETVVVEPFSPQERKQHPVRLWFNVQTHEHNLVFGKRGRTKNGHPLIIECSVPAFRLISKTGNPVLQDFVKKIRQKQPFRLSEKDLPMDAEMLQCVSGMIHYEGAAELKKLFLYGKMIELLAGQLQSYQRSLLPAAVYVRSEYDKERILFARDYLLTHLDAPPSLLELAAIAGINEFKLKKGFKELFGETVFAYLANVRLEMARRAVLQKQKTMTQIAFELGYASLQHFSAAFRKRFGVPPARFGKTNRHLLKDKLNV